jgi:3D (Asp-Asp-Asp) domain-containing protein
MRSLLLCLVLMPLQAPELPKSALVAQLAEQEIFNFRAAGSIPAERTILVAPVESSWWWIRATVTGYSPHDAIDSGHASTRDTKTATMRDWRTNPYGLAADPRIIPYGTYVRVPGYLEKSEPNTAWEVDDTGGNMRKSWRRGIIHIDVRFRTEGSAQKFGKKNISVLVDISEMTAAQKKKLLPYKTGEL